MENYQLWLEKELAKIEKDNRVPRLLLHSCCGPCSSYVLEYLTKYFDITIDYYNPNISPESEFQHRLEEQKRLLCEMPFQNPVSLGPVTYDPERFETSIKGLEQEPEGGARCMICYRLRLEHAAKLAKEGNFDYFTTTLSVSPYKKSEALNRIGLELSEQYGIPYLCSDFKKRDGYKRSIQLSAEYGLYRQPTCGCIYSDYRKEST